MTPEEKAEFIIAVIDTSQSGVYPSEADIETLAPHVEAIQRRYGELRGTSFQMASRVSRAEFIASAIREAEDAALERAIQEMLDTCRDEGHPVALGTGDWAARRIRDLKHTKAGA